MTLREGQAQISAHYPDKHRLKAKKNMRKRKKRREEKRKQQERDEQEEEEQQRQKMMAKVRGKKKMMKKEVAGWANPARRLHLLPLKPHQPEVLSLLLSRNCPLDYHTPKSKQPTTPRHHLGASLPSYLGAATDRSLPALTFPWSAKHHKSSRGEPCPERQLVGAMSSDGPEEEDQQDHWSTEKSSSSK